MLGRDDSDALTPASQRSVAEACATLGRMEAAPTDETSALTPRASNEDSGMPPYSVDFALAMAVCECARH